MAEKANVVCQDDRSFRCTEAGGVAFGSLEPLRSRLVVPDRSRSCIEEDYSMGVPANGGRRGFHRLLQVRHDHVDAACKRLCLARLQVIGQPVNVRVPPWLFQKGVVRQAADSDHRGVREVPEGLEVTGPLRRVGRTFGNCLVDEAVPDRVHHRLVLRHCVHDAIRRVGLPEGQRFGTGQARNIRRPGSAKALKRIGAEMNGTVTVCEQAGHCREANP